MTAARQAMAGNLDSFRPQLALEAFLIQSKFKIFQHLNKYTFI